MSLNTNYPVIMVKLDFPRFDAIRLFRFEISVINLFSIIGPVLMGPASEPEMAILKKKYNVFQKFSRSFIPSF